jgi:hypothetical protein
MLPIHDRRRHRRILTIKNFGIALGVAAVLFAIITIASEVRRPKAGEYGRLVAREVPKSEIQVQPREIVTEASVPDETAADPMLIASQARAQYLGVNQTPMPVQPAAVLPPVSSDDFPSRQPVLNGEHGKVTIVGDANGVALVTQTSRPEQTLTGGYFRQQ